jgi:hypothetical protein
MTGRDEEVGLEAQNMTEERSRRAVGGRRSGIECSLREKGKKENGRKQWSRAKRQRI